MFNRIRIDMCFSTLQPMDSLRKHALALMEQAVVINPGLPNEERGFISTEQCFHDEDPLKPCKLLEFDQVPF